MKNIVQSFLKQFDGNELIFEAFDSFTFPVGIFAEDGTAVYLNHAFLELYGITDLNLVIGKYNLLKSAVSGDLEDLGKVFKKASGGETVSVQDYRPPIQELIDHGIIKEKPFESAIIDIYLSPIHNSLALNYVLCVYIVKTIYRGRPELIKAKEYLNLNWHGKFNPRTTAKSLNMSVTQLYNLFKEHANMTPGEYHKLCKIEHIKEKLLDKNLSVKEAFSSCGEDCKGQIARCFKKETGLSPAQWRARNNA